MNRETLLIADDISNRTETGRLRSLLIRENAIELARKMHLTAEYLFVHNVNSIAFKESKNAVLTEAFNTVKASIEEHFRKADVPLSFNIKYGVPSEEILNELDRLEKPKILVLGTQGKKGLQNILLGSVAEEVIRNSKVPTLVLGPVAQEKKAVLNLNPELEVQLLTDLTESSLAAEKFVMELSQNLDCSVRIIHGIGEEIRKIRNNFYSSGFVPFDMEKMFGDMIEEARKELHTKTHKWQEKGLKVTSLLLEKEESLDQSLEKHLSRHTGLMVMGTRGRNKFMSSFFGSTARSFILTSPIPVMIVRTKTP